MSSSDPLEIMEKLLQDWPKNLDEPENEVRQRLQGRISDTLPSESLRTTAREKWLLASTVLIHGNVGKCLVIDTGDKNFPVMAELTKRSEKWVLTSFYGQCPVCFGVGVNDDEICEMCFGMGWGISID